MALYFLNNVANDAESTQKSKITSQSLVCRELINRIRGSCLSASLAMSTSVRKALHGKLDIKRHSPSNFYFIKFKIVSLNF